MKWHSTPGRLKIKVFQNDEKGADRFLRQISRGGGCVRKILTAACATSSFSHHYITIVYKWEGEEQDANPADSVAASPSTT